MYYPTKKIHFDLIFVILFAIAGAISQTASINKTPIQQPVRTNFIDLILEPAFMGHSSHSNAMLSKTSGQRTNAHNSTYGICAQLSYHMTSVQNRFCLKHIDLIEFIVPQVIHVTKKECARLTSDLRWTCSNIGTFLDRSNTLGRYLNWVNGKSCSFV